MSIVQRRLKPSDLNLNSHPVVPFSDGSNQKSGFQVWSSLYLCKQEKIGQVQDSKIRAQVHTDELKKLKNLR